MYDLPTHSVLYKVMNTVSKLNDAVNEMLYA